MSQFIDVFQFTGSQMQKEGNFFALMFFVMGIGALVVYFVIGWCSNVVAQVRHTTIAYNGSLISLPKLTYDLADAQPQV